MFVVLDTNHYNELASDSAVGRKAQKRIEMQRADVFISIISIQESVQGWLALINRKKSGREQLHAYSGSMSRLRQAVCDAPVEQPSCLPEVRERPKPGDGGSLRGEKSACRPERA